MFIKIMKNCYFYLPTIIYNVYNYLDIDIRIFIVLEF